MSGSYTRFSRSSEKAHNYSITDDHNPEMVMYNAEQYKLMCKKAVHWIEKNRPEEDEVAYKMLGLEEYRDGIL